MTQDSQEPRKKPLWKRYFLWGMPIAGIAGAFAAGIIFWGGFNTAMEATNTTQFCISCHEMRENVYEEYRHTIHYKNRTGVSASCSDCHVPDPWIHKMVRKVQASRELYHKALGTIDTPEKFDAHRLRMATRVWESMKKTDSRECRNCHTLESMSPQFQAPRARKQHLTAMQTGQTCIDCHKGIAHNDVRDQLADEDLERLETPNPAHIREVPQLYLDSLAYIEGIEAEAVVTADTDAKAAAEAVETRVASAVEAALAQAALADAGTETGDASGAAGDSVAANVDWNAVPTSGLTLFYPGQASFEWVQNGKFHGGARPLTKGGEPCASCHLAELETIGNNIVAGGELEPTPIPGKRGTIRVTAQAAHDGDNLYIRLQWPDGGHNPAPFVTGGKMDPDNQIKVAMMITGTGIEMGEIVGCWASCHADNTNMPFAPEPDAITANADVAGRLMAADTNTATVQKYLTESRTKVEVKGRRGKPLGGWDKLVDEAGIAQLLEAGTFLDLMRIYADGSASNGYLLDHRVENDGEITAQASLSGGTWTVVFARPLNSGAVGDVPIEAGKTYTFGIAIHDDYTANRFHHVTLESTLALDDETATLNVVGQ